MCLLCHQDWVGSLPFQRSKPILAQETSPVDLLTMTKYINLAQHLTKEYKKSIASSNAYYREFFTCSQCVFWWIDIYGMCEMTPEKVINQNYLSLHGFCRQRPTTSLDIRVALLHIIKYRQHKPGTPVTGLYWWGLECQSFVILWYWWQTCQDTILKML